LKLALADIGATDETERRHARRARFRAMGVFTG
jgi:hypothetical protein